MLLICNIISYFLFPSPFFLYSLLVVFCIVLTKPSEVCFKVLSPTNKGFDLWEHNVNENQMKQIFCVLLSENL